MTCGPWGCAMSEHTCCQNMWVKGVWSRSHPCGRPAPLEHKGDWYCKIHHPPTKKARQAAKPKCAFMSDNYRCEISVPFGKKYCNVHGTVTISRDLYERLIVYEKEAKGV